MIGNGETSLDIANEWKTKGLKWILIRAMEKLKKNIIHNNNITESLVDSVIKVYYSRVKTEFQLVLKYWLLNFFRVFAAKNDTLFEDKSIGVSLEIISQTNVNVLSSVLIF